MDGFAIHLDGHPISDTGKLVVKATRFGPAIYHILLAGVAGRCYRNLAFWRASPSPNGIELGELGQILGSQSFAGTVYRLLTARRHITLRLELIPVVIPSG